MFSPLDKPRRKNTPVLRPIIDDSVDTGSDILSSKATDEDDGIGSFSLCDLDEVSSMSSEPSKVDQLILRSESDPLRPNPLPPLRTRTRLDLPPEHHRIRRAWFSEQELNNKSSEEKDIIAESWKQTKQEKRASRFSYFLAAPDLPPVVREKTKARLDQTKSTDAEILKFPSI